MKPLAYLLALLTVKLALATPVVIPAHQLDRAWIAKELRKPEVVAILERR